MSKTKFVKADITKIGNFIDKSDKISQEFSDIKKEFNRINEELLKYWKGEGAEAYEKETKHILEKIGSVDDVLESLCTGVLADIRENYSSVDEELGEYNRNPYDDENEG